MPRARSVSSTSGVVYSSCPINVGKITSGVSMDCKNKPAVGLDEEEEEEEEDEDEEEDEEEEEGTDLLNMVIGRGCVHNSAGCVSLSHDVAGAETSGHDVKSASRSIEVAKLRGAALPSQYSPKLLVSLTIGDWH
jgi:hypothetical protein